MLLLLAASIVLLAIGVPRFLAELMLVPGTPILAQFVRGQHVSEEDFRTFEDSRLQSLRFATLPGAYTDLGMSYLQRARQAQGGEDRALYANKAIEALTKGLALAPLDSYAWIRLCSAQFLLGPDHYPQAVSAWRASVATARFEPQLVIRRVHFGILLLKSLNETDRDMLKDQLHLAFTFNKGKLKTYAWAQNIVSWLVYLSADDPALVKYMGEP